MPASDPLHASHIIAGTKLSARYGAHVIQQQIVILGPAASVSHHPFENPEHLDRLHAQPGLLQYLATHSLVQSLARFDQSSRYRPVALQRMLTALDQKYRSAPSAPAKNQRAHAG